MPSYQARVRFVPTDKEIYNDETGVAMKGADILKQLKINNLWRNDREGKYFGVMFDGQTFKFREGQEIVVPVEVARHLRRMSAVCVGSDKLNGPLLPCLEIAETFDLMAPKIVEVKTTPTTCPICQIDQQTFPALMRHQMEEHSDVFKPVKKESKIRSTITDEVLED